MREITVFRPTCVVDFHSERGFYSSKGEAGDLRVSGLTPTADLISVTTSKTLSNTAGSFIVNFPLVRGADGLTWYERVEPNDLVVIKMARPPEALHTVMIGLVDDIRKKKVVGADGKPQNGVSVTGRDLGKAFLKAVLRYFPEWAERHPLGDQFSTLIRGLAYLRVGSVVRGTPARILKLLIDNVLDALFAIDVQYWTGTKTARLSIQDILGYRLGKFSVAITPEFDDALNGFEGAIWNYIQLVSMSPFMEVFADTRNVDELMKVHRPGAVELDSANRGTTAERYRFGDSKFSLFLRQSPFDKEDWDALMTHEVTPDLIQSWEVGRNDHQKFTAYWAYPEYLAPGSEGYNLYVPPLMTSVAETKKFGLNVLDVRTRGFVFDEKMENQIGIIQASKQFQEVLERWHRNNHRYENGKAVMRGNPLLHVGQRIHHTEDNRHYYVEEVSHNFVRFGPFTTSVTLTRGQPDDGSWFADPGGQVTTFHTPK
jgi:hypothetical protein